MKVPGKTATQKVAANIGNSADEFDLLKLENQLCFALYAATRALTKAYRVKLEPMGLTYPQFLVLIVLWERDGLTITEIGDQLMLDSGTLTPLVKRLEVMGLVSRERGTRDEREVHVHLSAKGQSLRGEALEARRYVGQRLRRPESDILAMRSQLMTMIDDLEASEENSGIVRKTGTS